MSTSAETANRPKELAIHFDSLDQQYDSGKFGMWLFLATELLFFAGLFTAYAVFRANNPEMFHYAQYFLDWKMGMTNTFVLLASSFTAAWSVRAAQTEDKKTLMITLAATFFFACVFMVIKYFEYSHKLHEGVVWGGGFAPTEAILQQVPAEIRDHMPSGMGSFFAVYFCMTGLHGIHVLVGMGLYAWLFVRARKGHFNRSYYGPVDNVALYWHIVDMIWIFLFPMLYLIG